MVKLKESPVEAVLSAIRKKSNEVIKKQNGHFSRLMQLRGMIEIIGLLAEAGVKVPAVTSGFLQAEIDRISA